MKKIIYFILFLTMMLNNNIAYAVSKTSILKNNQSVCKKIKSEYKTEKMFQWINGLASDNDFLNEIDSNIKIINSNKKKISSKIKSVIFLWNNTEQDIKYAIINKDINKVAELFIIKTDQIKKFDTLCNSIKK